MSWLITAHEQVIAHHKTIDLLEQRNRDLEDILPDQASKLGITDSAVDLHFREAVRRSVRPNGTDAARRSVAVGAGRRGRSLRSCVFSVFMRDREVLAPRGGGGNRWDPSNMKLGAHMIHFPPPQ